MTSFLILKNLHVYKSLSPSLYFSSFLCLRYKGMAQVSWDVTNTVVKLILFTLSVLMNNNRNHT